MDDFDQIKDVQGQTEVNKIRFFSFFFHENQRIFTHQCKCK